MRTGGVGMEIYIVVLQVILPSAGALAAFLLWRDSREGQESGSGALAFSFQIVEGRQED